VSGRHPELATRPVVVTGGASGIGAAIVAAFRAEGAPVVFLDIDDAAGAATASATGAHYIRCDITDTDALRDALAKAEAQQGPARVLVNNAANDARHDPAKVTPEDWDRAQSVNIRAQFFAAQGVRAGMKAAGGGAIVNLSSVAWEFGAPDMIPYITAKAAVIGLTNGLARAFGPDRIRVNAVSPGAIMTPKQMALWHTPESKARLVGQQALNHDVTEADVADAVVFLASDAARSITKQCLIVDGGLT
jgi:NAD(P)-dependent dehydrogenase (short-subunit alcohol dehydrogenase family)